MKLNYAIVKDGFFMVSWVFFKKELDCIVLNKKLDNISFLIWLFMIVQNRLSLRIQIMTLKERVAV